MDFTDTIPAGDRLRLRLHSGGSIVLEAGFEGAADVSRTIVRDPEALRKALFDMTLIQAERQAAADREARASEPIDDVTRQAVFAALREVYPGRKLSDPERLEIVSKLAGREIWSMSRRGNMTMTDAHRVLDVLSTLRDTR